MLAARRGLNVDAMTERMDKMTRMRSRFHNGQFRGSFGSSLG